MSKCEECIHYAVCVNSYCHEPCGYYEKYRPRGEWINTGEAIGDDIEVKCSLCGEELYWLANFCPNCGADMRKEGDEK